MLRSDSLEMTGPGGKFTARRGHQLREVRLTIEKHGAGPVIQTALIHKYEDLCRWAERIAADIDPGNVDSAAFEISRRLTILIPIHPAEVQGAPS